MECYFDSKNMLPTKNVFQVVKAKSFHSQKSIKKKINIILDPETNKDFIGFHEKKQKNGKNEEKVASNHPSFKNVFSIQYFLGNLHSFDDFNSINDQKLNFNVKSTNVNKRKFCRDSFLKKIQRRFLKFILTQALGDFKISKTIKHPHLLDKVSINHTRKELFMTVKEFLKRHLSKEDLKTCCSPESEIFEYLPYKLKDYYQEKFLDSDDHITMLKDSLDRDGNLFGYVLESESYDFVKYFLNSSRKNTDTSTQNE